MVNLTSKKFIKTARVSIIFSILLIVFECIMINMISSPNYKTTDWGILFLLPLLIPSAVVSVISVCMVASAGSRHKEIVKEQPNLYYLSIALFVAAIIVPIVLWSIIGLIK